MSTSGQIAGSAAMLTEVGVVVPAATVVAGPAAAAAGTAGPDILGAVVWVVARFPGIVARSLWRSPVGGASPWRFFAQDLSSPAPDRSLRAMWVMLAALPAPKTTRAKVSSSAAEAQLREWRKWGKGLTSSSKGCTPYIEFVAIFCCK